MNTRVLSIGYSEIILQRADIYVRENTRFWYKWRIILKKKNKWNDHYAQKAKKEKWLARSVYKLEEIDKRFKIIQKGDRIVDLGCYPGSWSQYCLEKVSPGGKVIGIDQKIPEGVSSSNFRFIEADVLALNGEELKKETGPVNVVISDLAPKTTGIHFTDVSRSIELAEKALMIALSLIDRDGRFLCKVFEGSGFKEFKDLCGAYFYPIKIFKPPAVRKKSRELYLTGLSLREEPKI